MDIKEIKNGAFPLSRLTPEKKKEAGQAEFAKALKEAKTNVGGENQISSPPPAKSEEFLLEPAFHIQAFQLPNKVKEVTPYQSQGIQEAESALNLLDQYQKALADPAKTLKSIDPLVQELMQKVDGFQTVSEKISPTDPLHKLLRDIEVISKVEIEKFNRGEYI